MFMCQCTECREYKPLSEFPTRKRKSVDREWLCNGCKRTGLTFFIDELEKSDMKDCIGMMKVLLLGKSAMEGDEGDEIAKSMMQLAKVGLCAVTNKASIIPLLRNAGTYRDDTVLESSDY